MQIYKKKDLLINPFSYFKKYFFLVVLFFLSISVFSQEKRVDLVYRETSLSEIITEVEKKTGYSFAYKDSEVDVMKKVSLSVENLPLTEALTQLFGHVGYTFKIIGTHIFLSPGEVTPLPEEVFMTVKEEHVPGNKGTGRLAIKSGKNKIAGEKYVEKEPDPVIAVEEEKKERVVQDTFRTVAIKEEEITNDNYISLLKATYRPRPLFAVKTNLLYDMTTTINAGVEWRFAENFTLDLSVNYNPWTFSDNSKIRHLLIQPEVRYWIHEPFNKHFVGVHVHYARFNSGNVPFVKADFLKNYRYQGNMFGAGISYGYQWYLAPRWSLEATFGVGYSYLDYGKYNYEKCGDFIENGSKHYFGLDKVGVSLIYILK